MEKNISIEALKRFLFLYGGDKLMPGKNKPFCCRAGKQNLQFSCVKIFLI